MFSSFIVNIVLGSECHSDEQNKLFSYYLLLLFYYCYYFFIIIIIIIIIITIIIIINFYSGSIYKYNGSSPHKLI